jgi:hypothetical protein
VIVFHVGISDVEILVTLADRQAGIWPQQFIGRGSVPGKCHSVWLGGLKFEALAADGNVGAAQTAWFPGLVGRADGVCNVLW